MSMKTLFGAASARRASGLTGGRLSRGVGSLVVAAAALLPLGLVSGVANADPGINLVVGGAGDLHGEIADRVFHSNGQIQPGEYSEVIQYDASIGPIVGVGPMREAVQGGANLVVDAVHRHLGQGPITVHCFSEGSAVCDIASNILHGQGIFVSFNMHADGYGAAGIANSQAAETVRPITDAMGVPNSWEIYPAPGSVQKLDGHDLWASNAAGDWGKIAADAMTIPQTHRIINPDETAVESFVKDGVTYCVYGDTIPVPDGAELIPLPRVCLPA